MRKLLNCCILLAIITIFIVGLYNSTHPRFDVLGTETYIVSDGDTLWSVADKYIDESIDVRDYIYLIYEYNEGLSEDIKVGQTIVIPLVSKDYVSVLPKVEANGNTPKLTAKYTSLGVPDIDSSFKAWMSYKAVTSKQSPQYKFIHNHGWSDSQGFMRASGERDLGITDDYYLIALGSYYGTTIGTKYRITTSIGNVFYGVLADCKDNMHTNSTNQYNSWNGNVIEFLVDTSKLNKDVKRMGSANVYMPLNGSISKIERIDFVME